MKCKVYILPLWAKNPPGLVISTVSKAKSEFSPFTLGPCDLYWGLQSQNMENAWQYSKVYPEFTDTGSADMRYWRWAMKGWDSKEAHRYPVGKGRRPLFNLWKGEQLGYVDARKRIYAPLYINAVEATKAWRELQLLYREEKKITLLDYDAYDHRKLDMTLTDVLNCTDRKMGHAFVLAMLLTGDKALKQLVME